MKQLYEAVVSVAAGAAVMSALAGCASGERKTVAAPQSQDAYVDYASDQVGYWRGRTKEVAKVDRSRVEAAVRDAEVSLEQLKRASEATWRTHRSRMEDSLSHLERVHRQASLDR